MNANIRRLAVAFVIIFGLISIDLVYWQVIDAGSLNANVHNPRSLYTATRVLRGRIYDRNGALLVGRRVYSDGFVQPLYRDPSLAQTVGFTSLVYGDTTGLEASLNPYLVGTAGTSWSQTYNSWLHRPVTGDNVYLTIDDRIQQVAINALAQSLANQGLPPNTPAAAVALNPQTGEVLAMVSEPYFNATCLDSPETPVERACYHTILATPGVFVNRVTNGHYPPGSTFKTVTLSSAIDSGIQKLSDRYNGTHATGPFTFDGFTLYPASNNLPIPVNSVSLLQAYMWSDNIVFAQVGLKLGASRFLDYVHRFRFGSQIPFDIPVSISNVTAPHENFDPVALATSAFGQGKDDVTPMQMALVASTMTNGGRMPKPYVVKAIKTPGGAVVGGDSEGTIATPISQSTAATVHYAMVQEVNGQYGSGYLAQIPGVTVGGKTGTAQTGNSTLDTWFISFASSGKAKVACAVVIEGGSEGAYTAAPVAKQIMEAALQYGE